MSIPLYLKLKSPSSSENIAGSQVNSSLLTVTSPYTIEYNSKPYTFTQIFHEESHFESLHDTSCVIMMGPTGSGKTTTLKKVLRSKITSLGSGVYMTAFEISGNKYMVDLLDFKSKKEYNWSTYDAILKKQRLDAHLLEKVFDSRSTSRTAANELSSRSCLVITLYWNNEKCTYIDLMGNEKYENTTSPKSSKSPESHISNIFANMNMSSITQLLTTKSFTGRSSNMMTNLILKNVSKIKVVLTLDPYGDASLVKSSMNNIVQLMQNFRLGSPLASPISRSHSSIPSYARATASSTSSSPRKHPVLATSTPAIKNSSIRKLNTPAKLKVVPSLNKSSTQPKSAHTHRAVMSELNSSPVSQRSRRDVIMRKPALPQITHEKVVESLKSEVEKLKQENQSIIESCKSEKSQLQAEIEILKSSNLNSESLINQLKELMNLQLTDFKDDFSNYKSNYGDFKSTVENLKITVQLMDEENMNLKDLNSIQSSELISINDQLEFFEINQAGLKYEVARVSAENDNLKRHSMDIEKLNLQLMERDSEKEVIILEYTKELSEKNEELSLKDEQLSVKDALIGEKNESLDSKDRHIAQLNKQLEELNLVIASKNEALSGSSELVASLKAEVAELSEGISSRDAVAAANNELVNSKNKIIESLKEQAYAVQTELESNKQQLEQILLDSAEFGCVVSTNRAIRDSEVEAYKKESECRIEELSQELAKQTEINVSLSSKVEQIESNKSEMEDEFVNIGDQMSDLETTREVLASQVDDLKDQLTRTNAHWSDKYNQIIVSKDQTISRLHNELAAEINSPLLTNIDMIGTGNFTGARKPFDSSEIFHDNILSQSSTDNSIMEQDTHSTLNTSLGSVLSASDYKKRVLTPANENYKTIVNAMAKEKKHRKSKSKRIKGLRRKVSI